MGVALAIFLSGCGSRPVAVPSLPPITFEGPTWVPPITKPASKPHVEVVICTREEMQTLLNASQMTQEFLKYQARYQIVEQNANWLVDALYDVDTNKVYVADDADDDAPHLSVGGEHVRIYMRIGGQSI